MESYREDCKYEDCEITPKEEEQIEKLVSYLNSYKRLLVVSNDDVPTPELQKLRSQLRQLNIILTKPKNFFMRQAIKRIKRPDLDKLLPYLKGQIMILGIPNEFSDLPLIGALLRDATAAKLPPPYSVAKQDIFVEKQHTFVDPSYIRNFADANIQLRILKGRIDILTRSLLVKKGDVISPNAHYLLALINDKPYVAFPEPNLFDGDLLDVRTVTIDMHQVTARAVWNVLSVYRQIDIPISVPLLAHNGGKSFVYNMFNKESHEWFLNKHYWVSPKLFRKRVFDGLKKELDLSSGELTSAIVNNPMLRQLYFQLLAISKPDLKGVRLWYSEYLNVKQNINDIFIGHSHLQYRMNKVHRVKSVVFVGNGCKDTILTVNNSIEQETVSVNKGHVLFLAADKKLKLPHSCPLLIIKCVSLGASVLQVQGRHHPNKPQVSQVIGHNWPLLIMEVEYKGK